MVNLKMESNRGGRQVQQFSVAALVVILMLLAYVGGYCLLVQKGYFDFALVSGEPIHHVPRAEYRLGGDAASVFFRPIHSIDRLVRREYWTRSLPPTPWPSIMELEQRAREDKS